MRIAISANTVWNIVNFRSSLVSRLISEGHEVSVFAPWDEYAEKLKNLGCLYVKIDIDRKGLNPFKDFQLLLSFLIEFNRFKPDVFLGFTIKPNVYGSIAAHILSIPVINNISGLGTTFISSSLLTKIVKILYRVSLFKSIRIFFQNVDDLQLFLSERLVDSAKAEVLPGSGVDLSRYSIQKQPYHDGIRFLFIARLLKDKGIREYVAAAAKIRMKRPDCIFQILGFLDDDNRTAITKKELADWVGSKNIVYLGSTDDVRSYICDADCIVLPSYREGTPRTLLEGAAMSKPLVTCNVPGCRDVVSDNVNGYLCEARSIDSLVDAFDKFLNLTLQQRISMGKESRKIVEKKYDVQNVITSYISVINSLSR